MLNVEQMEAAVRELIEECKKHPDDSEDDVCAGCRFCAFCDKFYTNKGAPWHWRIDGEEVGV